MLRRPQDPGAGGWTSSTGARSVGFDSVQQPDCASAWSSSAPFNSRALPVEGGVLPLTGKRGYISIVISYLHDLGLWSAGPLAPPAPGGSSRPSRKPRLFKDSKAID